MIVSSTGPTAAVGILQNNTVALLPTEIAGQNVEYIVLNDASDPTNAVTGVKTVKPVAQGYIKAYEGRYGSGSRSTFGANTRDVGLLL